MILKTGKWILLFILLLAFGWSCTNNQNNEVVSNDNPLLSDFNDPFGTPPFEKMQLIHDGLVLGIRDYFNKLGFSKAILGLS